MGFESRKFEEEETIGKHEITEAFSAFGKSFELIYSKNGIQFANRISAAEAGVPIKPEDAEPQKLLFLKNELEAYSGQVFKGQKKEEWKKELEEYKMPVFSDVIKKDANRRLIVNEAEFGKYAWALTMTKLEQGGVRDFREAQNLDINIDPSSGRTTFSSEQKASIERFSYDFNRLAFAVFSESRDGDKEFTILPYAHIDEEKHAQSKSVLVLNDSQREKLRRLVIEFLDKNL